MKFITHCLQFIIILCIVPSTLTKAQDGFVANCWDEPINRSSLTMGQLFNLGFTNNQYANEGVQQPFIVHRLDTTLYADTNHLYRLAHRSPLNKNIQLPTGDSAFVYLLPTHGIDSIMHIMTYHVKKVEDTTVIAPYSTDKHIFALSKPTILPTNANPKVQYKNNAPESYIVNQTIPIRWDFDIANCTLIDTQWVAVLIPPCGKDNYEIYTSNATTFPYIDTLLEEYIAKDFENNPYHTVRMGYDCWTKENIRSSYYADGQKVGNPMIYISQTYPEQSQNFEKYGYLYTWTDATRIPTDSTSLAKMLQGICPSGWHIPDVEELERITHFPSESVITTTDWITNNGTNSTDYSLLPAGKYSDGEFQNLHGEANVWSSDMTEHDMAKYLSISYNCSDTNIQTDKISSGKSIRCIKD